MKNIYIVLIAILFWTMNDAMAYHDRAWNKGDHTNQRAVNASGCSRATSSTTIEYNNVRALIHTGGDMWWDLVGLPKYEIPKGSGKTALFAGAIWMGGTDINDQLRIAALKFRSNGVDYWPGPLIISGMDRATVTPDVCSAYDKHFVITRQEVSEFRNYINAVLNGDTETLEASFEGYQIPDIITNWPGNGDDSRGYDFYLAPYIDNDGNGEYNPEDGGDYPYFEFASNPVCGTSRELRVPRLYGDLTMWWVYNDKGNVHTETNGESIGMEVRAQYFAFATADELNNMTFGNYALINRSTYTLYNTYFGVWTDADLGDAADDYVGCDVKRGLGYLYNGDDEDGDGNNTTYGKQPPAIGVDFFEGPYMDPNIVNNDTLDRPSAYVMDADGKATDEWATDDVNILFNGSINGLNFGDSIPGNERWGMRRFLYFENNSGNNGDPVFAQQYYNYLDGYWKDNRPLVFGGTGYSPSGASAARPKAYFMFPGSTDPKNWGTEGAVPTYDMSNGGWTEVNENNAPNDKRFVQSAGPFTLQPGAVNDITVGMVWARATSGGAFASVQKVQEADDKAQKLFDNCFVMIDGPDSPELKITELNQELIVQIFNLKSQSNNYNDIPEDYSARDPFIVLPQDLKDDIENDETLTIEEKAAKIKALESYKFEGYQVFQVKDKSVTTSDLDNPEYSRLVYQCDVRNDVSEIINFENDPITGHLQPVLSVDGTNIGIEHTFRLTEDAFALSDKALVNHKKYFYIAVAYAYNEYKKYDPADGSALDGQKSSYLRGRKSASGSIKTFTAIPHINQIQNGGIVLNSSYGDEIAITQLDGSGCGNNGLNLSQESLDQIMSGAPWKTSVLKYEAGGGPISVKIIDPLNVKDDKYIIRFDSDSTIYSESSLKNGGFIDKTSWYLYSSSLDSLVVDTTIFIKYDETHALEYDTTLVLPMKHGITNVLFGYASMSNVDSNLYLVEEPIFKNFKLYPKNTVFSNKSIEVQNEQIISELGIAVNINQVKVPGPAMNTGSTDLINVNNGLVSTEYILEDKTKSWMTGIVDTDDENEYNWIRSGVVDGDLWGSKQSGTTLYDPNNDWAGIFNGTFSLYRLAAFDVVDASVGSQGAIIRNQVAFPDKFNDFQGKFFDTYKRTPSVNIVITKDTNLWSRCPVVEMCDFDTLQLHTGTASNPHLEIKVIPGPSENGQKKFYLRRKASVYRNGKPMSANDIFKFKIRDKVRVDGSYTYPQREYVAEQGMGWFPGYAIDVETGERLNIFFGEDSRWGGYNGSDMIWNPHYKEATELFYATGGQEGEKILGAKHNVYVWGHSYQDTTKLFYMTQSSSSVSEKPYSTIDNSTAYDEGKLLYALLTRAEGNAPFDTIGKASGNAIQAVYNNVSYVFRPMLNPKYASSVNDADPYAFIKTDITMKIRMANPYRGKSYLDNTFTQYDSLALNNHLPMYEFSTEGLGASYGNQETAESALDIINIVPNPYYAYDDYELKQTQKLVKITNLPENCVISIYNIGGNLVKKFDKSSPLTYVDWDLKNEYGIEIAGGIYIIHINVPGVGEKVLKWFGTLRPIDLNNI